MTLLGCHPDVTDFRDITFGASPIANASPLTGASAFDYRSFDVPRVQAYNSCVGHASAGAAALCMAIAGTPIQFPSPAWPWAGARLLGQPGTPLTDRGCSIRNAFKWMNEFGMVAESRWPESAAAVTSTPPFDAFQEGECAQLRAYYRIVSGPGSGLLIQAALSRGYCPVFGMEVDEAFEQIGKAVYATPGGRELGGHAMVIVGYVPSLDAFIVRNTWSATWGDDGYGYIAADFVENSTYDIWVISVTPEVR